MKRFIKKWWYDSTIISLIIIAGYLIPTGKEGFSFALGILFAIMIFIPSIRKHSNFSNKER